MPTDIYTHDFKLDLVDHNLKVIDYYDALKPAEMERLRADIKLALEAAPPAE